MAQNTTCAAPSAADLRARLARNQVALYRLAVFVDVHPARLGQMLGGRVPLPPDLARRIATVLDAPPVLLTESVQPR